MVDDPTDSKRDDHETKTHICILAADSTARQHYDYDNTTTVYMLVTAGDSINGNGDDESNNQQQL